MATLRDQIASWGFGSAARSGALGLRVDPDSRRVLPASDVDATVGSVAASSLLADVDHPVPGRKGASAGYYATKTRLHQMVISRVDLAAVEAMPYEQLRSYIRQLVQILIDEKPLGSDKPLQVNEQERSQLITELQDEILGLGPLEPLMADPSISEILVNGYDTVYVEREGLLEPTSVRFNDDAHLRKIIDKIVNRVGRRIDEASPMVDARLPDGSRVNAVIPPVTLDGPALSIRRFAATPLRMKDLIEKGTLTAGIAELLAGLVRAKTNIVISGGTGSGKTTLLNILSSYIPANERIITIEDTAELQLQQPHVVRMETRTANIEGRGEIAMRALVRNSLRMRPDRIVLGEVRGSEAVDMLQAMNTGHEGSLTTIHANGPRDALARLENLVAMGGMDMPLKVVRQQIASAIHVIIQIGRLNDGSRKLLSLHEVAGMEGEVISTEEIFAYERRGMSQEGMVRGRFRATGVRPALTERLKTFGIELSEDLFDPFVELE